MEVSLATSAAPAGDDVPILNEALEPADSSLPDGAERNADGSVMLTFEHPVVLAYRMPGGAELRQDQFNALTLRRLSGRDMRQVLAAKGLRASQVALALSSGLNAAKMALLFGKMDASDTTAAQAVVSDLIGLDTEPGLPAQASVQDGGGIMLPLMAPAEPEGFEVRHELVFRRLRGDDLIAISQAKQTLPAALARGTGLAPREADAVFDAMDAADIMAMQRVVSFLSGSGRRAGS